MVCAALITLPILLPAAAAAQQSQSGPILLDIMTAELQRAFASIGHQSASAPDPEKQLPPYFLSYSVSDAEQHLHPRTIRSAG